ncbi:MAG TPA: hypothetical protein VMI73_14530 [Trebonia sp.]|nr:hypothetical protein [Trebonia sp.]
MVTTEELRPASTSAMVDESGIPLTEIAALGPEVLWRTIERALPGLSPESAPAAAFQSSI